MGRPSKYKAEFNEQAKKLCLLGATDAEIGMFFDVDERTINRWKVEYPEFCQSLKEGKIIADMDVATKLHERATGYDYIEEVAFKLKTPEGEKVEVVALSRHTPPDATSMVFWLKNRRPNDWRDKVESKQDVTITGNDALREALAAVRSADPDAT